MNVVITMHVNITKVTIGAMQIYTDEMHIYVQQLCSHTAYNPSINVNLTQICTTHKQSSLLDPLCLY